MVNKIAIGCDHAGFFLKNEIVEHLKQQNIYVLDKSPNININVNYVVHACAVANSVIGGEAKSGILICGTGVGISIAANKFKGIRAVVCSEPYTAKLSRAHNNANILAFGARVVGSELAKMIVDCWLGTTFEAGRHKIRINAINELEKLNFNR